MRGATDGWLGFPGATEARLAAAESRLGVSLPPSYRAFLRVSNGWRVASPFVYRVWGCEEIEWLRVRNRHLIDVWVDSALYVQNPRGA
jgi:cell wall assembly regulator SMI1